MGSTLDRHSTAGPVLEDGEIRILNVGTGKVLKAKEAGDGAEIGQSAGRKDNPCGRWRLIPISGARHQYQIENVATGMVIEVADRSRGDRARIVLCKDHDPAGAHKRWRLVPVAGTEYALLNVHSGKAIDVWDAAEDDDAEIVQVGYWHGPQQRWKLVTRDASTASRAVLTMVRNESVFLPIWLEYYRQFFQAEDTYVLDHQSTDGSTEGGGFVRVAVQEPSYGAGWHRDVVQRYQHELVDRYDVVLCTDVDEIVAPDPRSCDLGEYIDGFVQDFVTCQGYEVLHERGEEPSFDDSTPVLGQRSTWYFNPMYSKSLLARVPMLWHGGFHQQVDGMQHDDPRLYLIHLHRMDYDICLARHRERCRFPLARIDREQSWGYQNTITELARFDGWFYHDSGSSVGIRRQRIPPYWRDVV